MSCCHMLHRLCECAFPSFAKKLLLCEFSIDVPHGLSAYGVDVYWDFDQIYVLCGLMCVLSLAANVQFVLSSFFAYTNVQLHCIPRLATRIAYFSLSRSCTLLMRRLTQNYVSEWTRVLWMDLPRCFVNINVFCIKGLCMFDNITIFVYYWTKQVDTLQLGTW